jgi:glycosyltransferase involved in cell wall biosynthesis
MFALRRLTELLPDVTIHFAGWPMARYVIPFRNVDHGILPLERLAELYSQCDAALVFSFSNVSLLPLEIMACGCPVVSNGGANVEWLLNSENSLLVAATPEAIVDGLSLVLTDSNLHQRLSTGGMRAAVASSWQFESDRVSEIISYFVNTK